jgi:hypothetical protein
MLPSASCRRTTSYTLLRLLFALAMGILFGRWNMTPCCLTRRKSIFAWHVQIGPDAQFGAIQQCVSWRAVCRQRDIHTQHFNPQCIANALMFMERLTCVAGTTFVGVGRRPSSSTDVSILVAAIFTAGLALGEPLRVPCHQGHFHWHCLLQSCLSLLPTLLMRVPPGPSGVKLSRLPCHASHAGKYAGDAVRPMLNVERPVYYRERAAGRHSNVKIGSVPHVAEDSGTAFVVCCMLCSEHVDHILHDWCAAGLYGAAPYATSLVSSRCSSLLTPGRQHRAVHSLHPCIKLKLSAT